MHELFDLRGTGLAQYYDIDDPFLTPGDGTPHRAKDDPYRDPRFDSYVMVGDDAFLAGLEDQNTNITIRTDDSIWFYFYFRVRTHLLLF
jgi:hypothetical protein